MTLAEHRQRKLAPPRTVPNALGVNFGRGSAFTESNASAIGVELGPLLVVEIRDDGAVWHEVVEQPGFRGEVALHRAVIVQVIAREVRERHDVEEHTFDALLVERVRRDLHRYAANASVEQRAKYALQLDRSRGRESPAARELLAFAPDQNPERSDGRALRAV